MSVFIDKYPFLVGIISFLIGLVCMPIVMKVARTKHFVARPNKRMSHTGEVPNIGGLNIGFSLLFTYLIFEFNNLEESQSFLIGLVVILFVGLVDDLINLSALKKFIGEVLAGIALIGFANIRITHLHGFLGINEIGIVSSYILSMFVLIGIINALNLIDGVDGLASGLGIIYCLFFSIWFQMCGENNIAILGYSMVGALAIFFIYNVFGGSRRKIFMGDSGSLMLGYLLSAFVFYFCTMNAYPTKYNVPESIAMTAAPAVCICVLSVPIFDTLRVILTRLKKHKSPFVADKNHVHHLLLSTGLNHIQTTCMLLSVSLLLILLAILGRNWNMWLLIIIDFAICTILTFILWRVVSYRKLKSTEKKDNQ